MSNEPASTPVNEARTADTDSGSAPRRGPTRVVVKSTRWVREPEAIRRGMPGDRCGSCGYDLSGSMGVACPECGQQVGSQRRITPEPPLGAFLLLTTCAYSLSTIGCLVMGLAGMFGAIDGPSRTVGAIMLVLAVASAVIVRWLVHRPEGYPDMRPKVERVLVWLGLGVPAALIMSAIVVLVLAILLVLVRAFVDVDVGLQPVVMGILVGGLSVVGIGVALARSLRK